MRWPFQAPQERKTLRLEGEKATRKRQEAARMLADLFIRHYSMTPPQIIDELERIHEFYEIPAWAPAGEPGGYFAQLATELSQTALSPQDTARLVAMLSWQELRAYKDRGGPGSVVLAAIRNPSEAYIPALTEHVAWLEEELKHLSPSQYRTDVASELRLAKSAIQACRVRP
jgi:hypothetical protein